MKFSPQKFPTLYSAAKNFSREMFLCAILTIFALTYIFIYPSPAQAGFFSSFFGVITQEASANVAVPSTSNLQTMPLLQAPVNQDPNPNRTDGGLAVISNNALIPEISPSATVTDVDDTANTQISTYIVRSGDTLGKIAALFKVSINTIIWANDLGVSPTLHQGQSLVILPISGVRHVVKKGETLSEIASLYKADLDEILQYNAISSTDIVKPGDILIVPDGELAIATKAKTPTDTPANTKAAKINLAHDVNGPDYPGYYIRPIEGGTKTQGLHGYNGVDLANVAGTPIYAAARGKVIVSTSGGWNGGYGNYVVISHPNDTQTLYAHLQSTAVSVGDDVEQGQIIGKMGSTGKATGTHVHFEIRGAKNPF